MIVRLARRAVTLTAVLLLSTGCFEFDSALVVNANGTATSSQSLSLTPGFADIVRQLAELDQSQDPLAEVRDQFVELDKARKKELKKLGIKVTRYNVDLEGKTPTMQVAVKASSLAALDHMAQVMGQGSASERRLRLDRGDDGIVTLTLKESSPVSPPGGDEVEDEQKPAKPELSAEDQEKASELALSAMGEMDKLRITHSITVPGKIVSVAPESGASIDGHTVVWNIEPMALMMGGFDPDAGFVVKFQPSGDLPAKMFE